jgi:hypothetical protein
MECDIRQEIKKGRVFSDFRSHLETCFASTPLRQGSLELLMLLSLVTSLDALRRSINSLTKSTSTGRWTIRMSMNCGPIN